MAIADIVAQVRSYGCGLVEVTGGEPMLQKGIYELVRMLLEERHTVMIETSGERDLSGLDSRVIKIMDLKCPGSGEVERNRWENLDCLSARDEIKFVLVDRRDYEWAREVIVRHGLAARVGALLMSPVFGQLEPATLASWILKDRLPVRIQLQVHKQIWDPAARGV
jgi:7-carboxy-7-deazaguanine synthase